MRDLDGFECAIGFDAAIACDSADGLELASELELAKSRLSAPLAGAAEAGARGPAQSGTTPIIRDGLRATKLLTVAQSARPDMDLRTHE